MNLLLCNQNRRFFLSSDYADVESFFLNPEEARQFFAQYFSEDVVNALMSASINVTQVKTQL